MKHITKHILLITVAVCALGACATPGGVHEQQFALEKRACAELGLAPGSATFSQCALNLDATMFDLDVGR